MVMYNGCQIKCLGWEMNSLSVGPAMVQQAPGHATLMLTKVIPSMAYPKNPSAPKIGCQLMLYMCNTWRCSYHTACWQAFRCRPGGEARNVDLEFKFEFRLPRCAGYALEMGWSLTLNRQFSLTDARRSYRCFPVMNSSSQSPQQCMTGPRGLRHVPRL